MRLYEGGLLIEATTFAPQNPDERGERVRAERPESLLAPQFPTSERSLGPMPATSWPDLLALTHFIDPVTLLAGLAVVALVGLSKGNLSGAFALMGVPVLALDFALRSVWPARIDTRTLVLYPS